MIPARFPKRHQLRHTQAVERQEAFAKLSPQQQLAVLDTRLGAGQGAVAQRIRLNKLIKP